jgi:hypothetical protein
MQVANLTIGINRNENNMAVALDKYAKLKNPSGIRRGNYPRIIAAIRTVEAGPVTVLR